MFLPKPLTKGKTSGGCKLFVMFGAFGVNPDSSIHPKATFGRLKNQEASVLNRVLILIMKTQGPFQGGMLKMGSFTRNVDASEIEAISTGPL
jgi:hypothetical protein